MGPLELAAIAFILTKGGNGSSGGWRQLAPNSKGQYSVPAGALFAVDVAAASPYAPVLVKQVSDLGGQVLPPTLAASAMPIDWPQSDETRTQTARARGAAKSPKDLAIDMGVSPNAVRVWVKQ